MSEPTCATAADTRRWIEYWLDELDPAACASLEAHLFKCPPCEVALERIVALGTAIRALYKDGHVATIVSPAFVQTLKDAGLSVREYRLAPNTSVYCSVAPQDDFVVSRLEADLADVTRLDAVIEDLDAGSTRRLVDIPFNAADGEVVLLPPIAEIRPLARQTLRVQVIAVEPAGERTLGTYTFNHRGPSA